MNVVVSVMDWKARISTHDAVECGKSGCVAGIVGPVTGLCKAQLDLTQENQYFPEI